MMVRRLKGRILTNDSFLCLTPFLMTHFYAWNPSLHDPIFLHVIIYHAPYLFLEPLFDLPTVMTIYFFEGRKSRTIQEECQF